MDGTLYDSMPLHVKAWTRLADELRLPHSPEEFYLYEGMTGAATLDILFRRAYGRDATDEEKTTLYRRKTEYFSELPLPPVMPGALEFLEALRSRGITSVIVTGSGQGSLIGRLLKDFPGLLSEKLIITAADVKHGKPDPEPYLMAMERARATPEQSVVVENAPLGVRAGIASGAYTIALTTGPIPPEKFLAERASLILPSMRALASITKTI